MVRRTPSKILDVGDVGGAICGAIWACGLFSDMAEWRANNDIQRVVNLLPVEDAHLRHQVPNYTHMDFNVSSTERVLEVLRDITDTVYSGGNVLVHCRHGLHRTGAIITLWIAMALAVGDSIEPQQSVLSDTPRFQRLQEAFNIWSEGRQLTQASIEGNAIIHLTSVQISTLCRPYH